MTSKSCLNKFFNFQAQKNVLSCYVSIGRSKLTPPPSFRRRPRLRRKLGGTYTTLSRAQNQEIMSYFRNYGAKVTIAC